MSLHNRERRQLASVCALSVERDADTASIRLEGEFDLSCEDGFRAEVARITAWQPSAITVDLRDLTFIDSPGLAMFLDLAAVARSEGFELTLAHAHGQVAGALQITGLDRLLPLAEPVRGLAKASRR